MMLGNHAEISSWRADALAVPGGQDAELRLVATALHAVNSAATGGGDYDQMETGLAKLRGLASQLVDVDIAKSPFVGLVRTVVAFFAGDTELAERFAEEAISGDDEWARAAVRMFRANMFENVGDLDGMRADNDTALVEFRELGERWGLAGALRGVAHLHTLDGRLDEAAEAYREAIRLTAELNSRDDEGFLFGRLADLELRRGNVASARDYVLRARAVAEERGAPVEAVFTLALLGAVEQQSGNLEEARRLQREAMRRVSTMSVQHPAYGHVHAILFAVSARIAHEDGQADSAAAFGRDAFTAAVGTRDLPVLAAVGVALAQIIAVEGDPAVAAQMLGAAARLRGADDPTAREIADLTTALRTTLGPTGFEQHYNAGKALHRDAAIERLRPS
jgi:tetratricopeptide (TPR) repeat protein